MELRDLLPEIEKSILPFLESGGMELVEMSFHGRGRTSLLRITLWKKGGIGIDEISKVSRHVGDILDQRDIIPGKYTLEVSSPGLDRELRTEADFRRAEGEKTEFFLNDGTSVVGEISSVADGRVNIMQGEEQVALPIEGISKGKIKIEF
jgi:ribosome maturation factor RimP